MSGREIRVGAYRETDSAFSPHSSGGPPAGDSETPPTLETISIDSTRTSSHSSSRVPRPQARVRPRIARRRVRRTRRSRPLPPPPSVDAVPEDISHAAVSVPRIQPHNRSRATDSETIELSSFVEEVDANPALVELDLVAESTQSKSNITDIPTKESRLVSSENHLFFCLCFPFQMCYFWIFPLLRQGFRQPFTPDVLPDLPHTKYQSDAYIDRFWRIWNRIPAKRCGCCRAFRLFLTTYAMFGAEYIFAGLFQVVAVACMLAGPIFTRYLLLALLPGPTTEQRIQMELYEVILPPELRPSLGDEGILGFRLVRTSWDAWKWAIAVIGSMAVQTIFSQFCVFIGSKVGMKIRTMLISLIYQKALKLSHHARIIHGDGKIVNLISNDCLKLDHYHQHFHDTWSCAVSIAVALYFLFDLIGWEGILAAGLLVVVTGPFMLIVSLFFWGARKKYVEVTDARLNKMNEVFQAMKIIKSFTWENSYYDDVMALRSTESNLIRIVLIIASVLKGIVLCAPNMMTFAGLLAHYFARGELDAVTIFTSMLFFNVIRKPLLTFPLTLIRLLEGTVSFTRIQEFLTADEIEASPSSAADIEEDVPLADVARVMDDVAIALDHASFSWVEAKKNEGEAEPAPDAPFGLHDLTLRVRKGELIMVVGKVGSGKSSLLSALIGQLVMNAEEGARRIAGSVAYCDQTPWILNDTLENNVLFGRPMQQEFFDDCISVCCLDQDLEILRGGVKVHIGERGVNLSGGQKYRVSLARACYSDSDIYLLDDPLAAVDAGVGRDIFENCVLGMLREKTVVLVTHHIQHCAMADRILVMDQGRIVEFGTYEKLRRKARKGGVFEEMMRDVVREMPEQEQEQQRGPSEARLGAAGKGEERHRIALQNLGAVKMTEEEERQLGGVSFDVVLSYFHNIPGGVKIFALVFILYVIAELLFFGGDWFLSEFAAQASYPKQTYLSRAINDTSTGTLFWDDKLHLADGRCLVSLPLKCVLVPAEIYWVEDLLNGTGSESRIASSRNLLNLALYGGLSVLMILALSIVSFLTLSLFLGSSSTLFKSVARRLFQAPMRFFDSNPIGRIISRVSHDVQMTDVLLNISIDILIAVVAAVLGCAVMIIYTTKGLFIPFVLVVAVLYYFVSLCYRRTSVELTRLNSISRSPMLSNLGECLNGLATIRAFRKQPHFIQKNYDQIDEFNRSHYLIFSVRRWLEVYIGLLSTLIYGATCTCCIIIAFYLPWSYKHSFLSLGITDSILISALLSGVVFLLTNVEVQMNAVERLQHYATNVPMEESDNEDAPERRESSLLGDDKNLKSIPFLKRGAVEFVDYSLRYREDLPVVLHDVSFVIRPRERIGIVGRTGSGKTSLANGLFRIVEPHSGTILLDGLDIRKIDLRSLRENISIIPQDPILFAGTVRSNLDPFSLHLDDSLWYALRTAHLEEKIRGLGGLDHHVDKKGDNFSVGERQLLCLARAIIKLGKGGDLTSAAMLREGCPGILVLDECSASVDYATDRLLQKTIRSFPCTILTIAHRLRTVIKYDKILLMDEGRVVEFDTPWNLATDHGSRFAQLVRESSDRTTLMQKASRRQEPRRIDVRMDDLPNAHLASDLEELRQKRLVVRPKTAMEACDEGIEQGLRCICCQRRRKDHVD